MTGLKRLVLDVLKPHNPTIMEIAIEIGKQQCVIGVNIGLYEVDQQTENVKITIEGSNIDYEIVKAILEDHGAVIHSIDEVAAGRKLIEESPTEQD